MHYELCIQIFEISKKKIAGAIFFLLISKIITTFAADSRCFAAKSRRKPAITTNRDLINLRYSTYSRPIFKH